MDDMVVKPVSSRSGLGGFKKCFIMMLAVAVSLVLGCYLRFEFRLPPTDGVLVISDQTWSTAEKGLTPGLVLWPGRSRSNVGCKESLLYLEPEHLLKLRTHQAHRIANRDIVQMGPRTWSDNNSVSDPGRQFPERESYIQQTPHLELRQHKYYEQQLQYQNQHLQQKQQEDQRMSYPQRRKRPSPELEVWHGRPISLASSGEASYRRMDTWVSTGGIDVVSALCSHKKVVRCSLQCPDSTRNSRSILYIYEPDLEVKTFDLTDSVNTKILYPRLSELEEYILSSEGPPEDFMEIASETTSRITVLTPTRDLTVGDAISLRIDLCDSYGRARRKGGDEIYVWISDVRKGAGTPGFVIDLNNGSYLATVSSRWPGRQEISVSLHHPREIVRTGVFLRAVLGTMRYLSATFQNASETEVTLCSWYPIIPGYNHVCNMTSHNGGLPWFCGKPSKSALGCAYSLWRRAESLDYVSPLPVTTAERIWIRKMNRAPFLRTLNTTSELILHAKEQSPQAKRPRQNCSVVPHSDTWVQGIASTSGWFLGQRWRSGTCHNRHLNTQTIRTWLRGKHVYLLGDSNIKQLYDILKRDYCTHISVPELPLPSQANCSNPQFNTNVIFRAHAQPFNLRRPNPLHKSNAPLSRWLEEISQEDVLVVLHLFLHFSQYNIPLYAMHVKDAHDAVHRLLLRLPGARVVLRGTHVTYKGWPMHLAGGDHMAREFNHILKRQFSDLRDRVMFLNTWDMSVAVANLNFHPDGYFQEAVLQQIFNHYIGR